MPRTTLLSLALTASLLASTGCQSAPEKGLTSVPAEALRVAKTEPGPWRPEARYEEIGGPWRVVDGRFATSDAASPATPAPRAVDPFEAPVQPARRPVAAAPSAPKLKVLRRRARREARPVGKRTGKSAERLAREHFLDYPTRVVAQKITLYLPPAYAREARLTGASVSPPGTGRRMARGEARLTVRELTLQAERITLHIRADGREDVQIMARGGVRFVADIRGNTLREEGLRSLLITNDQVVPIR